MKKIVILIARVIEIALFVPAALCIWYVALPALWAAIDPPHMAQCMADRGPYVSWIDHAVGVVNCHFLAQSDTPFRVGIGLTTLGFFCGAAGLVLHGILDAIKREGFCVGHKVAVSHPHPEENDRGGKCQTAGPLEESLAAAGNRRNVQNEDVSDTAQGSQIKAKVAKGHPWCA